MKVFSFIRQIGLEKNTFGLASFFWSSGQKKGKPCRVEAELRTTSNLPGRYIALDMPAEGFPCGSAGKESTCSAGDLGLIPGLGRSPGEGKGYPLQYSGHGVAKNQTRLSNFHFNFFVPAEGRHRLSRPHRRNCSPKLTEGLGMIARGLGFQNHANISFSLLMG